MSKYKPVRLTSVLCKVMEKLIRKKIIEHEHSKSLQKQTVRFISGLKGLTDGHKSYHSFIYDLCPSVKNLKSD